MTSVIELDQVSKIYKMDEVEVQALNGINLKIKKKDFVSIMGPSGSGKSTLLQLMGALDKPTKGKVFIDGIDVSRLKESDMARVRGKKIGFVFQSFNLYPTLTALENVELPMIIMDKEKVERKKRAMELLELVGLKEWAEHLPAQLSGGERQRVAIARSLANNPSFILADEPTGNLDSKSGNEIMKLFVNLNEEGRTIVVVTHDVSIASHSRHIVRVKDGKILGEKK